MTITIRDLADDCTTRELYAELCRECGSDAMSEEQAILSAGREFLPACAQEVMDGNTAEPVPGYWLFLADQTVTAQEEHERELAANTEVAS